MMSAEKRSASNSFGSSQVVKRQKSDANLTGHNAVEVVNGNARNGALIQAVSSHAPCGGSEYCRAKLGKKEVPG